MDFRTALKPGAAHNGAGHHSVSAYYPVLRMGKRIMWAGASKYRKADFGADAKQMAADEAETVLHCDRGSLMAEQLQRAVETGEPIEAD